MEGSSKLLYVTVEEYLGNEEISRIKHEYVDGRLFAKSGTTRRHNTIAGNVFSALRSHVLKSACQAYIADIKVQVESANCFYYPDVMVACDGLDSRSVFTKAPVLIVEVLSKSTASIDRREKVSAYRQIPCLQEYLIVHQLKRRIELHQKIASGQWQVLELMDGTIELLDSTPPGAMKLSLVEIYEGVDFAHHSVKEEAAIYANEVDLEFSSCNDEEALDW